MLDLGAGAPRTPDPHQSQTMLNNSSVTNTIDTMLRLSCEPTLEILWLYIGKQNKQKNCRRYAKRLRRKTEAFSERM